MQARHIITALIAIVAFALPALAQTTSMSGGAADDSLKYLGYMAAAYTVIWAAVLLYFISLGKQEKEIWEELEELKESLRGEAAEGE